MALSTTPKSIKVPADDSERLLRVVRDAALIVVVAAMLALIVNALRPTGRLPLIQHQPYEIVVPCPEPVGEANALNAEDPRLLQSTSLLIDARASSEFAQAHLPGALNIPFDWLGPPVEKDVHEVTQRVARSHARHVIVYGDGDDPDSGREWARLLAGSGIKNVAYVTGGAAALQSKLRGPAVDHADGGSQ